ncbi:uncharacterized protein LOC100114266 [Nasonia vitripennis]|uniref:MaoC-like domain-containing protein n=1 Tax=Nasonia vitripennis TaxID=7425 RepID=A0A7M7GB47_NASVI|nr:uncharacterized protein LOC100114266 [Nasonia vitripennis]
MFSTKEQLIKKTGKHGIGRLSFLEQLVNEYKTTKSRDHKEQVLANLANFAYDPVNYEFLRRLKVLELFMITLDDSNPRLVEFAIGGICNISVEPYSREYILRNHGVRLISNLLSRSEEHIVISALTTLLYLEAKQSKKEIASPTNVKQIQKFANEALENLKIGNRVSIQRTVTENDVLGFAKLTNDYNPIHINSTRNIVHGAFLNGLLSGILGTKLPGPGTVVVEQIIRYPKPCYVGDTVEISVEITSAMMYSSTFFVLLLISIAHALDDNSITESSSSTTVTTETPVSSSTTEAPIIACTCGVFLSGQFKKGSKEQPKGNAALLHDQSDTFPCSNVGNKMCTNKCLDVIVKHLPNSPSILCGSIDRDCHKERAYLFIKNCKDEWINTNLSAGREYCCKDGLPYKCPLLS